MRGIIADLEMTGLTMKDKPISLAALDVFTGKVFYAEFIDWSIFDINQSNREWMRHNVISNLLSTTSLRVACKTNTLSVLDIPDIPKDPSLKLNMSNSMYTLTNELINIVVGDTNVIVREFKLWMETLNTDDEKIIFTMDVGHYDFVFLAELFGGAFNLPEYIVPTYIDFNQCLATSLKTDLYNAFDLNRIKLVKDRLNKSVEDLLEPYAIFKNSTQHNALVDVLIVNALL